MSFLLLYPKTLGNASNLTTCRHVSLPYMMSFDIKVNHQSIQTTHSHASRCHHDNYCHYCNVDFVLFHNAPCTLILFYHASMFTHNS